MIKLSEMRKGIVKKVIPLTESNEIVKTERVIELKGPLVTDCEPVYALKFNDLPKEEVFTMIESLDLPYDSDGLCVLLSFNDQWVTFEGENNDGEELCISTLRIWKSPNSSEINFYFFDERQTVTRSILQGYDPETCGYHADVVRLWDAYTLSDNIKNNKAAIDFLNTIISTVNEAKVIYKEIKEVQEVDTWKNLTTKDSPYAYGATIKIEDVDNIHNVTYELINNNPSLFKEYGFIIADVTYVTTKKVYDKHHYANITDAYITIHSLEKPTEEVELTISVEV